MNFVEQNILLHQYFRSVDNKEWKVLKCYITGQYWRPRVTQEWEIQLSYRTGEYQLILNFDPSEIYQNFERSGVDIAVDSMIKKLFPECKHPFPECRPSQQYLKHEHPGEISINFAGLQILAYKAIEANKEKKPINLIGKKEENSPDPNASSANLAASKKSEKTQIVSRAAALLASRTNSVIR